MNGYTFWMVWHRNYGGDKRWRMVRTPDTWDADMVFEKSKENLSGGVGGDPAEILEVECGWDDGIWNDLTD